MSDVFNLPLVAYDTVHEYKVIRDDFDISCSEGVTLKEIEELKPTPQTKEVEWVNGDKCVHDCILGFSVVLPEGLFFKPKGASKLFKVEPSRLSKPETPEQKLERERVENGKAYYSEVVRIEREVTGMSSDSFHCWDKLSDKYREVYAMQAEAFNYKVKGE